MAPLKELIRQRFRSALSRGRGRATHEDVHYCYRLILRREPDEAGARFWRQQIEEEQISVDFLIDRFLESSEFLESTFARTLSSGSSLKLVNAGDFRIYVRGDDFSIGATLQRDGVWEAHVTAAVRRLLRPGGVFLDIGAGIGYFTLLAASITGSGGHVYAFEPEIVNFGLLGMSVAENGFGNVRAYRNAVSDRVETVHLGPNLQIETPSRREGVANPAGDGPSQHARLVRTIVLDELLGELGRVDLVKIDIEGAEPRALDGMRELLQRHRPVILTELFPTAIEKVSGCTAGAYLDRLRVLGYELFINTANGLSDVAASNDEILLHSELRTQMLLDLVARPVSR